HGWRRRGRPPSATRSPFRPAAKKADAAGDPIRFPDPRRKGNRQPASPIAASPIAFCPLRAVEEPAVEDDVAGEGGGGEQATGEGAAPGAREPAAGVGGARRTARAEARLDALAVGREPRGVAARRDDRLGGEQARLD